MNMVMMSWLKITVGTLMSLEIISGVSPLMSSLDGIIVIQSTRNTNHLARNLWQELIKTRTTEDLRERQRVESSVRHGILRHHMSTRESLLQNPTHRVVWFLTSAEILTTREKPSGATPLIQMLRLKSAKRLIQVAQKDFGARKVLITEACRWTLDQD